MDVERVEQQIEEAVLDEERSGRLRRALLDAIFRLGIAIGVAIGIAIGIEKHCSIGWLDTDSDSDRDSDLRILDLESCIFDLIFHP